MSDDSHLQEIFRRLAEAIPARPSLVESVMRRIGELQVSPRQPKTRRPQPAIPWNRITQWIGGLTMRQRMVALGAVGVAAVLGFVLLWGGIATKPVSAMEKMAEEIRKAKSYKATMITEMKFIREPDKPPLTAEITGKVYWLAPRSYRVDFKGSVPAVPGGPQPGPQDTAQISPTGKPGILIDHHAKTFQRLPPEQTRLSVFERIESLGKFSGQADHDLGSKQINGIRAHGFQIEGKKIDPEAPSGLLIEVWLDAESNLPLRLRVEFQGPPLKAPGTMRVEDIQWNVDLAPKLFEPTPPEGYVDATPKEPSLEERVRWITEGLRLYAELAGGSYPQVKEIDADTARDELRRSFGIQIQAGPVPPELQRNEKFWKVERSFFGLYAITAIQRSNRDAAYYGKTVGPKDKEKVLLRWKLDDGRYQVIFGDLRGETIAAERLRALEGK